MKGSCKICSTLGAAPIVDEMLERGVFYRDIGKECGFSKSLVHRHSKHVNKSRARELRRRNTTKPEARYIVQLEDGSYDLDGKPIAEAEITQDDLVIPVTFDDTPPKRAISQPDADDPGSAPTETEEIVPTVSERELVPIQRTPEPEKEPCSHARRYRSADSVLHCQDCNATFKDLPSRPRFW